MTYKSLNTKLSAGDVIAVAYSNKFYLAIFKRYGKAVNNCHFYLCNYMVRLADILEQNPETLSQYGKIKVGFINTDAQDRVIKININDLDAVEGPKVQKAINFLRKTNNI